jgi:hypothetical protein
VRGRDKIGVVTAEESFMRQNPKKPDDFFAVVPGSAILVFFAAVFFTFAPVALLMSSGLEPPRTLPVLLWSGLLSGLLAMCWAAAFTLSRWYSAGVVLFSLAVAALSGPFKESALGFRGNVPSLEGVSVVVCLVAGYVLFIVFISGQGRRTVRLQTEMSLAREIHQTLAPALEYASARVEALGVSRPSSEMGGDLVDVVEKDGITDLFVVDVSGHGVRAGVVMGMVKSALRMGLTEPGGLGELLGRLNSVLETTTSPALYATAAAVRIDPGRGAAEYVLAGHHPILRLPAGSSRIERLGVSALPLGMMAGTSYESRSVALARGDLLAIYTDGLSETMDAGERELGHEAIERCLVQNAGRPLADLQRAMFEVAERHGAQADDRSLLLVRMK